MGTIEVFADICCPFTHVGLRRLVERRDALGRSDVVIKARAWPLELVNGAPLDPVMIGEEVDALRAQVAPDLFTNFQPSRFPASSLPALRLAATAYDHSLVLGEQISLALRGRCSNKVATSPIRRSSTALPTWLASSSRAKIRATR